MLNKTAGSWEPVARSVKRLKRLERLEGWLTVLRLSQKKRTNGSVSQFLSQQKEHHRHKGMLFSVGDIFYK